MALKQSIYSITKVTGEDVVHFETDDKMLNIIKADGTSVGTLKELGFEGKVVNTGSVLDIKVSGLYAIQNLTGMPSGYDVGKISVLSVKAIGSVGTPTLVSYQITSQAGEIFVNTVNAGVPTGWTSGGTNANNTISLINGSIGTMNSLVTPTKTSLVGAINSTHNLAVSGIQLATVLETDFEEFTHHNHDDKYILVSGGTVNGDLYVRNNNAFKSRTSTGTEVEVVKLDSAGKLTVGSTLVPLDIKSSADVTLNGRKVWTDGNDGSGSGLDADKLGGIDNSFYARANKLNIFAEKQTMNDELIMTNADPSKSTKIVWKDGATVRGSVGFSQNGEFAIKGASGNVTISGNADMNTDGSIVMSSENKWNSMRFRRWNTQQGSGFEIDRNNENLVMHDWDSGKTGFIFVKETGEISFQRQIRISGRALYLQGSAPTGTRTVGDIWIG